MLTADPSETALHHQALRVNCEAIYGSRPWLVYGEGPTQVPGTGKLGTDRQDFTWRDVRCTRQGGNLYPIPLGRPAGKLLLRSLMKGMPYLSGPVRNAQLLGSDAPVEWSQHANGLSVSLPQNAPEEAAYVLRTVSAR